jgi:hypothetical protein
MKSPFPGMDPYLEGRWSDIHVKLIAFASEALQPRLPREFRARVIENHLPNEKQSAAGIESNVPQWVSPGTDGVVVATLEPDPSPAVDRCIGIIDTTRGGELVTAIEILTPQIKAAEHVNSPYFARMDNYARSGVSLVEIDLLRYPDRNRLPVKKRDLPPDHRAAYLTCVGLGWLPGQWRVYPMALRSPLPPIPVPLREGEVEVLLNLQPLIDRVYVAGGHDDIDYSKPPDPPLEDGDAGWARELIKSAGSGEQDNTGN